MHRRDDQKLFDELVSRCYECVLDESRWPDLLERLMVVSGRQQGGLLMLSERKGCIQVAEVNLFDSATITPYNQHYCHMDPGHLFMPQRAVGHWYHDFEDFGEAAIHRCPYYQEFQHPYGLGNISSVKLYETASASAYLSLLTNLDARRPNHTQQNLLKRLSPHLATAGRIGERLQHLELELAKRDLLLDQHPVPLWLLEENGQVVYGNQSANQHLSRAGFAIYTKYGRLHCQGQDASLQSLIRRAGSRSNPRRSGWLRLGGPPPLDLLITPVPAEANFNRPFQRPLVLLALLGHPSQSHLLAELFHLSPAEQRLAELLMQGLSAEACATRLNVSINTVRTQLRALYRKTQTERQAELISLIGRLHH